MFINNNFYILLHKQNYKKNYKKINKHNKLYTNKKITSKALYATSFKFDNNKV